MSLKSFFNTRKNNSQPAETAATLSSDQTGKKEWQEILSRWETVAVSAPDDAEAGLQVVNAHIQLNNEDLATSKLAELESRHPNNLQVMTMSARLLSRFGDQNSVRKKWEEIARLFPDHTEPSINLVQLALQEDNIDLAFDWSEKALALDPDDIRSLMLRAKIEQRREHWEEALRLWKRVNKARGEHYESELQ
nr:hypothetical protein [Gammaproteobacteria bacterium]